jgi:hypothetical protein
MTQHNIGPYEKLSRSPPARRLELTRFSGEAPSFPNFHFYTSFTFKIGICMSSVLLSNHTSTPKPL